MLYAAIAQSPVLGRARPLGRLRRRSSDAGRAPSAHHHERRGGGGGSFLAGIEGAQCPEDHLGSGPQCAARQCGDSVAAQANGGRRSRDSSARTNGDAAAALKSAQADPERRVRLAAAGARDHGADELHRRRQGGPLRSVRRHPGAAGGADHCRRGGRTAARPGQRHHHLARRRLRPASGRRFHSRGRRGVEGGRCAGEVDLDPRRRHDPRHVSAARVWRK